MTLVVFGGFVKQKSRAQSTFRAQVPDHVVYRHVFHHVLALKKRAEEAENNGDDPTPYRTHFKRQAGLNDGQAAMLELAAVEFGEAEKILNARARPVIDAYRAQFPQGQVFNHPVPPPAELHSLSLERDALVLQKRDQLHSVFGSDFAKFDSLVKKRVTEKPTR
jgi:hypothetical protein